VSGQNRSPVILWKGVRTRSGQVAQVVERSPEKAGVGGSTPSLATIVFIDLRIPYPPSLRRSFKNSDGTVQLVWQFVLVHGGDSIETMALRPTSQIRPTYSLTFTQEKG
jgi:hypothetical protein